MIEVIETYHADGTHADVVGGKKLVTVAPAAAQTFPGHYTNSIKMSRPNYWTQPVTIPAGFTIRWAGGSTRATTYPQAIRLAIYHARRK